jgi:hypothetical protein
MRLLLESASTALRLMLRISVGYQENREIRVYKMERTPLRKTT